MKRTSVWQLGLLLPWIVASTAFHRPFSDNSYLWHVRAGDIQIRQGSVLTADPFSYPMGGTAWRTQSWLADNLYSWLDGLLGLTAAPLVVATSGAVFFALLALIAFRENRSLISTVVFLVASTLLFAAFLNPRPVILSFPLMAATVLVDRERRLGWTAPLIVWIWASVHGSFIIGLAYLGFRVIARGMTVRRFLSLVAVAVPTLLTAHGWGVIEVLVAFVGNRAAVDLMTEWQAPDLVSLPFLPLLLGVYVLIYLGRSGRLARADWWIIVPFFALSLTAQRAAPPAWIALAPILSRLPVPLPARATLSPAVARTLGLLMIVVPLVLPFRDDVDESRFPVEAATHLTSERVFHDDASGGWLIYTQWPERKVYIDDRAEMYGERIALMAELRDGRGDWEQEFGMLGISEVLLNPEFPLVRILRMAGWNEVYEDENFVVLRTD